MAKREDFVLIGAGLPRTGTMSTRSSFLLYFYIFIGNIYFVFFYIIFTGQKMAVKGMWQKDLLFNQSWTGWLRCHVKGTISRSNKDSFFDMAGYFRRRTVAFLIFQRSL
jgi:hypothetical protein